MSPYKMGLEYCHFKFTHPLPSNEVFSLKHLHSPAYENTHGKFLQGRGEPNIQDRSTFYLKVSLLYFKRHVTGENVNFAFL